MDAAGGMKGPIRSMELHRVRWGLLPLALVTVFQAGMMRHVTAQQANIPKLGKVQGMACAGYPNASMYIGIPYATADRWKPPVLWDKAFQAPYLAATDWPPACPQRARQQYALAEDCLYLNIFAPASDNLGLPVRVYIHGGWFSKGSASSGTALTSDYLRGACRMVAQTNTIWISIQYRLGIFGFLSQPATYAESNTTGNWGIMDQQAALQWIKKYIQYFGGSPGNITLSGGNAGAVSVSLHMVSPQSQGLFTSAVSHNGFSLTLDSPTKAYGFTNSLAAGLGCTDVDKKLQLDCLRKADWRALTAATPPEKDTFEPVNRVFFPVVDGNVILAQPLGMINQGNFMKVPFTTILNKHVGRTVVLGSYKNPYTYVTSDYIRGFVEGIYTTPESSQAILDAYPIKNYDSTVEQFADIWQDMFITCPSSNVMQAVSGSGVPMALTSFQQPPSCHNAKSSEGPGDEQELSYVLNLDFVINRFCPMSPAERGMAYNVMWPYAQVMTNGVPQNADGKNWVSWDAKDEMATTIGPLPKTIDTQAFPLTKKCKLFDLPLVPPPSEPARSPPLTDVPHLPDAPHLPDRPLVPPPPPPVVQCFVMPAGRAGALKVANQIMANSKSPPSPNIQQVVANASSSAVLCYSPYNYVGNPNAKSALARNQRSWGIIALQGLIALGATMFTVVV